MAFKNGRLYSCDRCGTTVFCECSGEKETDGGYTRWNTFEPLPEGWGHASDSKKFNNLCPKCNEKYQKMIKEFEETTKKGK